MQGERAIHRLQVILLPVLCIALLSLATACSEAATPASESGPGASILDTGPAPEPGAWNELKVTGVKPPARAYHAMAYDPETKSILLFGGTDGHSGLGDTWAYDQKIGSWVELQPTGDRPSARDRHAMVYDSYNRQVVLFGGSDDRRNRGLDDTWVYDSEVNTWTETVPAGRRPAARHVHSMVYDSERKRVILFGGVDTLGRFLNDVWAYEPAEGAWIELEPPGTGPQARAHSAMVYDPLKQRVILFGGRTEDDYYNDTWAFDLEASTWTELRPTGDLPGRRSYHFLVYDVKNARVILYGGSSDKAGYWDTWVYDSEVNAWIDLDPPGGVPPVDRGHAMVYDPVSGKTFLFGGWGLDEVSDAVWIYDPSGEAGGLPELLIGGPSPRGYHDLFYDPVGNQVILFGGGTDATDYGDIWAYDPGANFWTDLTPRGNRPEARSWPALAYDSSGGEAFLFGGATLDRALNDLWTYDAASNRWTELEPESELPPERWLPAAVYVSADDTVLIFGGGGTDNMLNDTWAYDKATGEWTARDPVGSLPSPRGFHSLVYDVERGTVVLFGGTDNDNEDLGDTWAYDPAGNSWSEVDTSEAAPPARSGHAMAYDSTRDRIVLFGGATALEGFNDTWVYDAGSGRWEEAQPTGDLPSERAYHAMVYDSRGDQMILFGGFDGSQYVNDVWAYDLSRNIWTELTPMTGETTRAWLGPEALAAIAKESRS